MGWHKAIEENLSAALTLTEKSWEVSANAVGGVHHGGREIMESDFDGELSEREWAFESVDVRVSDILKFRRVEAMRILEAVKACGGVSDVADDEDMVAWGCAVSHDGMRCGWFSEDCDGKEKMRRADDVTADEPALVGVMGIDAFGECMNGVRNLVERGIFWEAERECERTGNGAHCGDVTDVRSETSPGGVGD